VRPPTSYLEGPITDEDAVYPRQWRPAYRDALFELRQYEGWRAYLPTLWGLAISAAALAVPLAVLAVGVFVVNGKVASYLVGLISLATAGLPAWALKSKLWARRTLERLSVRHEYDPHVPRVTVNVREIDATHAGRILREAGLVVEYARIGYGVGDPKSFHLAVAQWARIPALEETMFRDQVESLFARSGIWANVSGTEIKAPVQEAGDDPAPDQR
jgi:hypothetical protein